jgi:hypothetical protein
VRDLDLSAKLLRLRSAVRASEVETRLKRLARAVEIHFDPNQPRVPEGNPDGGQWTDTGTGRTEGREPGRSGGMRRISTDLEAECESQLQRDLFHCRMVGVPACYEQAMLRYSNCLVGRQIPPLNY